jgi:hypothetical protein
VAAKSAAHEPRPWPRQKANYIFLMEWKEISTLIAEAEFRLTECEKRNRRQREIVSRLELGGAGTEQARKLLSHLGTTIAVKTIAKRSEG